MMVNTDYLVPMTEANQNFSRVVRTVDENGLAVILKNNKPRYVVVDFDEYDTIAAAMQMRKEKIDGAASLVHMMNANTFTAGAKIDTINVERRPYQFLYKDEDGFNFMHEETYEQIHLDTDLVDNADLMKEGQHVEMMFLADEERCLTCELPTYVELEVTYTEPAVKGDTASTNAQKEITLETGAIIMAPLFINIGEKIRVNTTDRSYGERVK